MRRSIVLLVSLLFVATGLLAPTGRAAGARAGIQHAAAKRVCKTVTKKVHGKKRRVKVCHPTAVKRPAPLRSTPTPTATITATPGSVTAPAAAACLTGSWDAASLWTALGPYLAARGIALLYQKASGVLTYELGADGIARLKASHAVATFTYSGFPAVIALDGTATAHWSVPSPGTLELTGANAGALTYTFTVGGQDLSQAAAGLLGPLGFPSSGAVDDAYTCSTNTLQLTLPFQPPLVVSMARTP